VYSSTELITDSSFRCVSGDKTGNTFSLLECLRKNNIFYDISIVSDGNGGIMIRAYIESSTRYTITAGSILSVGGNYSSYVPKEPNKYVMLLNDGTSQICLEKHTIDDDISFNVTAPYEHLTFKDPISVRLLAYHVEANNIINEPIQNNQITVFPTTLTKFDYTSLSAYYYNSTGQKVNFLTHNFHRYYNYGEICALSVMSDKSDLRLVKKYYTVSGKYLGVDYSLNYKEHPHMRHDFYFELDLGGIESSTNKEVGYVEVVATYNGEEITNPIRYDITPKCNQNNEIFFVNELGGIDSFNFLGERTYKTKIKNQTTYFQNPTRRYSMVKELEMIGQKVNSVEHKLTSTILDEETARWLNELSKSKYPFILATNGGKFERIVVTDMDIDISDRENTFEVELTYKNGDNSIKL
jgi:hypothetical protein